MFHVEHFTYNVKNAEKYMNRRTFLGTAAATATLPIFRAIADGKTAINANATPLFGEILKTDLRILNEDRMKACANIQKAADACPARDFAEYAIADAQTAEKMRGKFAILRYFDDAFSKTAEWVKEGKPRRGEVELKLVYNMGYVVKTPTLTFAIDLCHPRGAEIAEDLDFLLITHNHKDHLSQQLINTLKKNGKPIVQNYMDTPHYSAGNRNFKFGDATIITKCCDHNSRLERFVLTYEIDCGESAGGIRIFHTGDACDIKQVVSEREPDVFIPHLAVGLDVPKCATQTVKPKNVLVSHILELGHDIGKWRWPISLGWGIGKKCGGVPAYTPLWGEEFKLTKA